MSGLAQHLQTHVNILNKNLSSPHLIPPVHFNCFPVLWSSDTIVPTVSLYQGTEHCVLWALSLPAPEASASLFVPFIGGYGPKEGPM